MYKRHEASKLKSEFWTTFGHYMNPVPSAEGLPIHWINYRTTYKDVFFRMNADHHQASISISLEQKNPAIRVLYFEKLLTFQQLLHTILQEEWIWKPEVTLEEGKVISRVSKELTGVSVYQKEDWPALISFFKPRLIALDQFWADARYSFEELR